VGKKRSPFTFNKQDRNGIFFLLLIIILLQGAFVALKTFPLGGASESFAPDRSVGEKLKVLHKERDTLKMYPFNPNYITDHKGYLLGLSTMEIDRLHAHRAAGKFVNSIKAFQEITKVSDSVLERISPYFKFPEWTQRTGPKRISVQDSPQRPVPVVQDLNTATAEQLKGIPGIGEVLSGRIVKFRERLGGFLVEEQLLDVYGLEPEVAYRALKKFKLLSRPTITKISLNGASARELSQLVYLSHKVARAIVEYRELKGGIGNFAELADIEGFPFDKIDRIGLYLSL
jgi:DNA uptake protein ComE-like DNA-binding protein